MNHRELNTVVNMVHMHLTEASVSLQVSIASIHELPT